MFFRKTCSKNFLKDTRNPYKMRPLDSDKKAIQCAYWAFTKKSKYFPRIFQGQKSEHFVQQLRCYNQLNWTYRFNKSQKVSKIFFTFCCYIVSQLLQVLAPASFSLLLPFVGDFIELQVHVHLIPNPLLRHKRMQLSFQGHLL